VQLAADRREQVAQVELLGRDLDIDIEVIPQADRQIGFVTMLNEVID
jgi:hypothetical protein